MSNHSALEGEATPADSPAPAPTKGVGKGLVVASYGPDGADSPAQAPACRRPEEMAFVRKDGIEMTYQDGRWLVRDTDLGRAIGLSRPRAIRERIKAMLEKGEITAGQITVVIDDGLVVYYVDQETATSLAFRSNVAGAEVIAKRMLRVNSHFVGRSDAVDAVPVVVAMTGYQRTLAFIGRTSVPAELRRAALPLLEKYARSAGLPVPDFGALETLDQPRLPGV